MGGVLALLGCAAVLILGAPVLLRRGRWHVMHPAAALGLWCATLTGGLLAAAASLVRALWIALARQPDGAGGARVITTIVVIFCWAAMAAVGALASLVLTRSEPLTADRRRTVALLTLLTGASTYRQEALGRVTVLYVRSECPVAASLPGPDPRIVVTSRVVGELTAGQLRAVIEHERAHLIRRHGRIVQLAQLNAASLPVLSAATEFHRVVRLLVELIADDDAARVCGRDDLAAALTRLAALTGDEGMLLRARRVATAPPRRRAGPAVGPGLPALVTGSVRGPGAACAGSPPAAGTPAPGATRGAGRRWR